MARSSSDVRELRRSVVKLFTVVKEPNYYQPWDLGYQQSSGGSGCIIAGRRILTNAHVVSNQVYIQALKPGDTKKYTARVAHVDHGSETALVSVDDPAFFDDTTAVTFGELPERQDKVAAFGFPLGGNELSITEGVVSRIEVMTYTHSQRELLAVQTDAAINPGNSGGPVFKDGKLIGIAFQSYAGKGLEKSGYAVPIPVIEHFLTDVATGACRGVPDLGVHWQRLESDPLRDYYGMTADQSGVLVTRVVHGSAADGALAEEDVIVRVAGEDVANDGSVRLRGDDRVSFSHLISQRQVGDSVAVEVIRRGRRLTLPITLQPLSILVPLPAYDVRPTYFIFAGLVFTVLTANYLRVWDEAEVDHRFKYYQIDGLPMPGAKRRIVIINQVLAHDANVGHHRLHNAVVDRINDRSIADIGDVLEAFRHPVGKHHVLQLDHHAGRGRSSDYYASFGTRIVLDAATAEQATAEALKRYGIASDRSEDLR